VKVVGDCDLMPGSDSDFKNGIPAKAGNGHFGPLVGTLTGIISERFPQGPVPYGSGQGEGRWTTARAWGFYWKVGGTYIANEKVVHVKGQGSSPFKVRIRLGAAADRPQLFDETRNRL